MKFKHKATGIVEDVTNAAIIPQYLKRNDIYEQVKEPTAKKPKAPKVK